MSNYQLVFTVQDVLDEFANDKRMFTAYDVTLAVRDTGAWAEHNDVKEIVHNLFQRGGLGLDYSRTFMQIPGTTNSAFIYHLRWDKPTDYSSTVNTATTTTTTATVVDTQPSSNGLPVVPNGGNKVCIPASALRNLGLKPGDIAFVSILDDENKSVVISTVPKSNDYHLYTVDYYNNVSFRTSTLQRFGLKGPNYRLTESNGFILLGDAF